MAIKKAVDKDASADRPTRPTPTHREPVQYICSESRGEANPDTTKPQFERKHETAATKDSIKAGAIKPGTIGDDRSVSYETGAESAKRREAHVMAKRKETEAIFDSHRKFAAKYPYTKNAKFKS
jgi:hypothetical protein